MVLYHNITTIFRTSVSAYHVRVVRCCIIQLRMQVPLLGRGQVISIMEVLVNDVAHSKPSASVTARHVRVLMAVLVTVQCTLARKRAAPMHMCTLNLYVRTT